jgi:hypothetical protein
MVHDTLRDRMLVFGGLFDGGPAFNDVWRFTLAAPYTWLTLLPAGPLPAARHHGGVIYDPVRDRLVVSGGLTASGGALSDTWALPLTGPFAWQELRPSGSAPALGACNAVYDAVRDRMVVVAANGVWGVSLDGAPVWTQLSDDAAPGLTLTLDSKRDRLLAMDPFWYEPGLWSFDLADTGSWRHLDTNSYIGGGTCRDCSIVYQPTRDRLVVFGLEFVPEESNKWYPDYETWAIDFSSQDRCAHVAQVVSPTLGADTWWPEPDQARGAFDFIPLTLGTGGSAVFRLDHPAADGVGYDLYVHENGATENDVDENYQVEASLDGSTFVPIGTSAGSLHGFDLAGSGLSLARFIRITDLAPVEATAAGMAGADIDAIEVVHCSETAAVAPAPRLLARSMIALVRPNPARNAQAFDLKLGPGGARTLSIYSADGRRVWSRDLRGLGAGPHVVVWDGHAANGHPVAPSVYFARLESTGGESMVRRIVRVR